MAEHNGIFVVIEGTDGSGKGTQFKLLHERLKAVGYEVEVFDFPRYNKPSSHFVRRYLNGDYGAAKDISPYTASIFYALDRYEAAPQIRKALAEGKIVLANRYVGSNMAHQGGKFKDPVQQRGFFVWEDSLEFQLLGLPRPTFNFYLRVPAEVAYKLIAQKAKREYTDKSHDEHEKDMNHLRRSVETYDTLCRLFPKDFQAIDCTRNEKMLSIAEINDRIWEVLKPILPKKPHHAAKDVVVQLNEQAAQQATSATQEETTKEPAMPHAQSSSDQFSTTIKKVSLLAIGHLQAADGIDVKIESIEWSAGQFSYYTQTRLSKKIADIYKQSLQKQLQLSKQMHEAVTQSAKKMRSSTRLLDAIADTTPLAALANIKISAKPDAIKVLCASLQNSPLDELRWLSRQLFAAGQKSHPTIFTTRSRDKEEFFKPPAPLGDVIAKLVSNHLPQSLPANTEAVTLLEAWPRNEFDTLVDALYPYSTSSRKDITTELLGWPYEQKKEALNAALTQENGPVLKQTKYLWNVICDRPTFENLKNVIKVQELKIKPATPRYGYEVPSIIEEAGLDGLFMECFDESLKLFSSLQAAELEEIAPYATLLGHKNRWQFTTTGELSSTHNDLLLTMREKISEVHPLIGEFLDRSSQPKASASSDHSQKTASTPQKRRTSGRRARKPNKK